MGHQFKQALNLVFVLTVLLSSGLISETLAQSTAFTYQGRLQDAGTNANGTYDFQFTLWDSLSGGIQQPQPSPATVTKSAVSVVNGVFTVQIDFGASAFPGADRFLETSVRLNGGGAFTLLSPRQAVTSTPYAIRSATSAASDSAGNATQLGGVAANQYVITTDARLSDARSPTAGSSNYIQNTTSPQEGSNFNISGAGTVGGVLSASQYWIGNNRVFAVSGFNPFPANNTFVGFRAGVSTTPANGANDGNFNSFFGYAAGTSNTIGYYNAFFGSGAGANNVAGGQNSFFGWGAGQLNHNGNSNSFFGQAAGFRTTDGLDNSFFGTQAGNSNQLGSFNTVIGVEADVGSPNLSNAAAIGARARVDQSNSLVLGSINGVNGGFADTNVGIGTTAPTQRLHVVGNGLFTGSLTVNSNFNISGNGVIGGNAGIGTASPAVALEVQRNSTIASDWQTGQLRISGASDPNMQMSVGYDTSSNLGVIQAGQASVAFKNLSLNPSGGNVGIGTTSPSSKLHVNGVIRMDALGAPVGIFPLCWNANDQIASCSSSSLRYKADVYSFSRGLELIKKLRPISFTWRNGGMHDIGLAAEEVAAVEPLLTYRNKQGEVEGVRYNQLSAVFINAFKEQQAQIEQQQLRLTQQAEQIKRQEAEARKQRAEFAAQQQELGALKKLVCLSHPRATVCR